MCILSLEGTKQNQIALYKGRATGVRKLIALALGSFAMTLVNASSLSQVSKDQINSFHATLRIVVQNADIAAEFAEKKQLTNGDVKVIAAAGCSDLQIATSNGSAELVSVIFFKNSDGSPKDIDQVGLSNIESEFFREVEAKPTTQEVVTRQILAKGSRESVVTAESIKTSLQDLRDVSCQLGAEKPEKPTDPATEELNSLGHALGSACIALAVAFVDVQITGNLADLTIDPIGRDSIHWGFHEINASWEVAKGVWDHYMSRINKI
jgi:hypothetical protein